VIAESPTVRLSLESRPETVTLVRGMLGGVADQLALDPELLDDLKTAVSEACNNVVTHAYGGKPGPMGVRLYVTGDRIRVTVEDDGHGIPARLSTDDALKGVGLPVIQALADEAQFKRRPQGGTEVEMAFAARRDGRPRFSGLGVPGPDDGWPGDASGDVVVSLSPVVLLGGVLGRLARALAAAAHFSLDRFSDVYLVSDALAAHAARAASGPRIGCRLSAGSRRLELTVGPFRTGSAGPWTADPHGPTISPLVALTDEVTVQRVGEDELLHVVLVDHR
jgi:serine/threonine-protein kinase RsbW